MVKGIIFPELCMAEPMELTLCPWGAQGGGEALVGRGLHCSSNGGKPGLGELLPSAPPQGLSPPGVLEFGVFIGFERVARFNLGVLQADPLLQPDLSSSPGSPDPCRPQRPCSSNNPPCNVGKMPISSVFCPKPSHTGGLGHPEVHTEVAGCFKPTCKWNGAAAELGFSFPSHLLARLPEGSAFLRSPLHGFRGLCSTRWRGGVKKLKIKYCKRGSKGFKSFLYSARGHSSVGRRAKLLPHATTGIQHRAPWGPGRGGWGTQHGAGGPQASPVYPSHVLG